MPYTQNRGQRIHYTVDGDGPLLVLQHGLFSSAANWHDVGYVDEFKNHFTVACVDSLGHGASDKPAAADLYGQAQRAADLVAVIDALGHERAHVVGYSMGAWLAVGVARHFPARLLSLTVGGWDCVNGTATVAKAMGVPSLDFETLIAGLQQMAPDMAQQATADTLPGLRACYAALEDLDGGAAALQELTVPVILWDGREDPYHDPMQTFAAVHNFAFLSTDGDHLGAMVLDGSGNAQKLTAMLRDD